MKPSDKAMQVAKACIARWHDTTDDNVIENIMTTDVADLIQNALDNSQLEGAKKMKLAAMVECGAGEEREAIEVLDPQQVINESK